MLFSFFQRKKILLTGILATLAFLLIHFHLYNPHEQHGSDSLENLAGAYNIAKYNTYAIWTGDHRPHATASREPLFPFMLGMLIKVENLFVSKADNINNKPIESIYTLTIRSPRAINSLKILNIAISYASIALACAFVYWATQSYLLFLYSTLTLVFSAALAQGAESFLTEPLAALLCTLVSILLYYSKPLSAKRSYWLALGFSLSALVLTKALYLYFLPLVFIYLNIIYRKEIKIRDKALLRHLGIFSACLVILVGGWMLRNFIDFNRFFIADRKAEMLMYRAEYDATSFKDYPYLFALYAPGLSKHFLTQETEANWTHVYNWIGNDQIIASTYHSVFEPFFKDLPLQPHGRYKQSHFKKLERQSMNRILDRKLGHLAMTIAFFYRCLFVEDGAGLKFLGFNLPHEDFGEKRVDNFLFAFLVNLPYWFGFFYFMITAIRKKDYSGYSLLLIPTFTILAYSCLAMSHPRYMQPMIPLFTILFCLAAKRSQRVFAGNRG
ncbi:MAG TPA: hypothetical protein VLH77_03990 [Gammaproteobacteria bacterium]|nr:hypothetical protein [Gammaproteobacteria bacterium]